MYLGTQLRRGATANYHVGTQVTLDSVNALYNSDSGSLFILVVHNSIGDNGAMIVLIKAKVPIDAQFPCVNIQARPIVDPCKGVKDM